MILQVLADSIALELREAQQWLLWKEEARNTYSTETTKPPYSAISERKCDPTEPWSLTGFEEALVVYRSGRYDGLGFAFTADDPYCGVDLDNCRDPQRGVIESWAQEIIDSCVSYAEVSPSGTGVKIFLKGMVPPNSAHKHRRPDGGAIELYDSCRYFTVTGHVVPGAPGEVHDAQHAIDDICQKYLQKAAPASQYAEVEGSDTSSCRSEGWETITEDERLRRCQAFVTQIPNAVSGHNGSAPTLQVACDCFRFGLSDASAKIVMDDYNLRATPPWSEQDLLHKLNDAKAKVNEAGEFGKHLTERLSENASDNSGNRSADQATRDVPQYKWWPLADFDRQNFHVDFIVKEILAAGQVMEIIGPPKVLKTTLLIDLALSTATGRDFLGRFPVLRNCKVALMSQEAGPSVLQETARRIAGSKGLLPSNVHNLAISTDLPRLDDHRHHTAIQHFLRATGAKALMLDNIYLALAGDDPANMFKTGNILRTTAEICAEAGATLIFTHHTKKSTANLYRPLQLDDVAWAGFSEFMAQWIFLSRQRAYEPGSGVHHLHMVTGGRTGHSGLWAPEIREGNPTDTGGRTYRVVMAGAAEARETFRKEKEDKRITDAMKRIVSALRSVPDRAETRSGITKLAGGLQGRTLQKALDLLLASGEIVRSTVYRKENGQTYDDGYRLAE